MTRRTTLAALLASSGFAQSQTVPGGSEDTAVLQALDNFLTGWNSREPAKYADALLFPHLILDDGHFTQYASREQFMARGKALWDSAPVEWDHSEWLHRQIVQRIGDTVHATGSWARKDKTGRTISTADVLYVVVRREGQWKIFARSGNRRLGR